MSGSKHFDKIAWSVTALMLIVTILFMNGGILGLESMARTMGYENRLFDNKRVHSIDIVMNDWDEFIESASSEKYYSANVVIDGESYKNIGIRGKGNTSLSTVSSLGSDRYSFKIEFDQYDSSLSYYGLDKLSLNNLIQDSTMMKDYLTYTMMREFDAQTPLCSFVYITVNGDDWGLYLAVEGIEDGFLSRNYGSDHGELYKPDSMSFGGGRGNGKDFDMGDFDFNNREQKTDDPAQSNDSFGGSMPEGFDPSQGFGGMQGGFDPSQGFGGMQGGFDPSQGFGGMQGGFDPSQNFDGSMPEGFEPSQGFGGGFGMGSSDVKLQYIDDEIDSYSNIWNNAKTDISESDQTRLIESLKKLSQGQDIEDVVDIEQVIRYFVVHNYVCNDDSYTGMMIHNYYLYEEKGKLSMLPWDYNLAFGTFGSSNATSTVNTPIDTPVSGGSDDRPMLNWIFNNEQYTEMYHAYFSEFLNKVDIQAIIDNAYELIKPYVKNDPTAFYSYEEFEKGVETLRSFCALRSESISLQLENGETTTNMSYVDASDITLSDMGSMGGMGGFGGGMPNMPDNTNDYEDESTDDSEADDTLNDVGNIQLMSAVNGSSFRATAGEMPGGFGGFGGEMSEGFDPSQIPDNFDPSQGFDPSQIPDNFDPPQGFDPSQIPDNFDPSQGFDPSQIPDDFGGTFPGQDTDGQGSSEPSDNSGSSQDNSVQKGDRNSFNTQRMPEGGFNTGMGGTTAVSSLGGWIWIAVSAVVLGIGLVIAKKYRY